MIVGEGGPAVVVSARTAAWLERYAGLSALRVRVRGVDSRLSAELEELRYAAMAWRSSLSTGTGEDSEAGPAAPSERRLTTTQAADLAVVTARAVRKAIAEGRLPATEVGSRYRVSREDLEHYRAARGGRRGGTRHHA